MKERCSVNYVYFGILFLILSFLHIYHISLIENESGAKFFFYAVYSIGQSAIEILILMTLGHLIARLPKVFNTVFITLTLLLFLVHLVDFPLVRIMGMTIWYVFDWITAESYENFIEMLNATHISLFSWMLAGLVAIAILLAGMIFFRMTDRLSGRRPIFFSYSTVGMCLFSSALFLLMFDIKLNQISASAEDGQYLAALPWKTTFFSSSHPELEVGSLGLKPSENQSLTYLQTLDLKPEKRPNIFLFITESLREDFLTPAVAPHLLKFKEQNIAFPHAIAAANGTQLSWFSIFQSLYPFYWEKRQFKQWESGSLPLQILKKAGYQIRVYSASRLQYYQMDKLLFGKDHHLADTLKYFARGERENHENDADCMAALSEDLAIHQDGQVFIVFLESTHFGYSWPEEQTVLQAPEEVDYLHLICSNNPVEGVRNRYRNSIHYIDSLFGDFLKKLESTPGGEDAAVVFTGDHGEEFFDQGRIFHASNLNRMQTQVPLYFRLGAAKAHAPREFVSHLDIFPSILDYVLGDVHFSWFDGESILHPSKKNFAIATRYNASRSPFEFLIHTGTRQLIARFDNPSEIFKSRYLKIVSHRDAKDLSLDVNLDQIKADFKVPLQMLFQ